MRYGLILALVAEASLCACAKEERRDLPIIEHASYIRLVTNEQSQLGEIRDQKTISAVLNFINERHSGWYVPWAGPPVSPIYAELCDGSKYVGNFGVGYGGFQRDFGNFFFRDATPDEVEKFRQLIGVGEEAFKHLENFERPHDAHDSPLDPCASSG